MFKRLFVIYIISLLAACSGSSEEIIEDVTGGNVTYYTISASISSSSSSLDCLSTTWSNDDKLTVAKISIDGEFATIIELLEFEIVESSISQDLTSADFTGEYLEDGYFYMAVAFGGSSDRFDLIYDGVGSYDIDLRMKSIDEQSRMAVKSELFEPADGLTSTLTFQNIFSLFEFDYRVVQGDSQDYQITEISISSDLCEIYQLVQFRGYDQDLVGCATPEIPQNIESPEDFATTINSIDSNVITFYASCKSVADNAQDPADLKVTVTTSDGDSSTVEISEFAMGDICNGVRYTKELRFDFSDDEPSFSLDDYSNEDPTLSDLKDKAL